MSKLMGAWAKDQLRGGIIYLLVVAIVVPLGCILILIPSWLALNLNLDDTTTLGLVVVPTVTFLVLIFGGTALAGVVTFTRRQRWLDSVFVPQGLTGSAYMLSGRRYQGTLADRQVEVRFYRGPTLDIFLSTSLKSRFSISQQSHEARALAQLLGYEPLTSTLRDLGVYAIDEPWTYGLLLNPQVQFLLRRLFSAGQDWALIHALHLEPGRFLLRLYRNKNLFRYGFTPEEAQQWLADLLALAKIAENLPAPQVNAEVTSLEQLARSPQAVQHWSLIITLGLLLGLLGCSAVAVVIGFWLARGTP
jgi:hypothetical protein